jgi:hypothetical protein
VLEPPLSHFLGELQEGVLGNRAGGAALAEDDDRSKPRRRVELELPGVGSDVEAGQRFLKEPE